METPPIHVTARRITATTIAILTLLAASTAPASDKAADLNAASQSIGAALTQYVTLAGVANGANQAYAAYKWTQTYAETKPGSGSWTLISLSSGDTEKLLNIAGAKCGVDSAQVVAQTTSQLSQLMGAQAAAAYSQSRSVLCQAVQAAAQLMYRYQQYQNYKTNGLSLKTFDKTMGFQFGNYVRHVSFRGAFKWYPDFQDTAVNGFTPEDSLAYVADFKWSDDPWMNFSVVKTIREMQGKDVCIPFASWAFGCFNIINAGNASIAIKSYARFRSSVGGETRENTLMIESIALSVPFAYLDQIAQMKDKAKQDLLANLQSQISSMLTIDQQNAQMAQAMAGRASAP